MSSQGIHAMFAYIEVGWLIVGIFVLVVAHLRRRRSGSARIQFGSQRKALAIRTSSKGQRKPQWVIDEVLRLKALMPANGCRKIATTFNHMHAKRKPMPVGESFVANVLVCEGHRIVELRRAQRRRMPRAMPRNRLWALDLTYIQRHEAQRTLFGLLDHGTRACLALTSLQDKNSITSHWSAPCSKPSNASACRRRFARTTKPSSRRGSSD